jgi:hypothetical protein
MKPATFAAGAALAVLSFAAAPSALAAVDVGVGVTIREPGVYGRIEIGNGAPPPPVIYRQPVIVAPPPVVVHQPAVVVAPQPPLYLYVPPGHAKHWRKHCYKYDACGRQVYFVREEWVQTEYVRAHPGKGPPAYGHSRGRGHGKHGRDD